MGEKTKRLLSILISVISIALALFHISYISGLMALSTMTIRVTNITSMMVLAFLGAIVKKEKINSLDYTIGIAGVILSLTAGGYILTRWELIVTTGGLTNAIDPYIGLLMALLLILLTYKLIGKSLAIVVSIFLAYPFLGQHLFGVLRIRSYSFDRVFKFLYTTTQGIFGIPLGVAASYIIFFCIFGGFLSTFGVGSFLFRLSKRMTSGLVASTAKTAIVFSTLMGMISGTAAGNVAVTGSLTIPMMKKSGYKPHEAAAVEAVASTGGQIMPPIMGAAAFIMAELTNTKYSLIMKSAIIPALVFFISIFIVVHLLALKNRVDTAKPDIIETNESTWHILKSDGYLLLPILSLIALMVSGYSPLKSALYSIIVMLVVYQIANREFSKEFLFKIRNSLVAGVENTMLIAIACAASGIIVGVISLTGVGAKFSALIIGSSGGNVLVALLFTMVTSIILGMGLPTTAAYLIPVTVVAPALVRMGIPLLTSHMFIFIFACVSTITPPVALASYVAAGISGADINKVGITAFSFGLASYILPFMLVYNPNIMLNGSTFQNIMAVVIALASILCVATAVVGYVNEELSLVRRVLLLITGLALVKSSTISFILVLIVAIAMLGLRLRRRIQINEKLEK